MATLYRVDGIQEEVRPYNGRAFSLTEMQTLVGGYIQIVPANEPGMWIVCDEDGKPRGKPVNVVATALWVGKDYGDPLVGTILVGTAEEVGFSEQEQEQFAETHPGVDMNQPFAVLGVGGPEDDAIQDKVMAWLFRRFGEGKPPSPSELGEKIAELKQRAGNPNVLLRKKEGEGG